MSKKTKLLMVNAITFSRAPLMLLFLGGAVWYAYTGHLWLFVFNYAAIVGAALTDLVDGLLARRFGVQTQFGAYADPLMDKIWYAVTLPVVIFVAAANGNLAHAAVLTVFTGTFLVRDQWVSFLRSIGSLYGLDAKANWSGKWRTLLSFPIICIAYWFEASPRPLFNQPTIYVLEAVGFIINLISIVVYTRAVWPGLVKSLRLKDDEETG